MHDSSLKSNYNEQEEDGKEAVGLPEFHEEVKFQKVDMGWLPASSRRTANVQFHDSITVDANASSPMEDCSFQPQESIGRSGWGSMAFLDLSMQDECRRNKEKKHSGNLPSRHSWTQTIQESTFVRNMDFLQRQSRHITRAAHNTTFVKNLKTIALLFTGTTR